MLCAGTTRGSALCCYPYAIIAVLLCFDGHRYSPVLLAVSVAMAVVVGTTLTSLGAIGIEDGVFISQATGFGGAIKMRPADFVVSYPGARTTPLPTKISFSRASGLMDEHCANGKSTEQCCTVFYHEVRCRDY